MNLASMYVGLYACMFVWMNIQNCKTIETFILSMNRFFQGVN